MDFVTPYGSSMIHSIWNIRKKKNIRVTTLTKNEKKNIYIYILWTLPHIGKRVEASIEKQRSAMGSLRMWGLESIVEELVLECKKLRRVKRNWHMHCNIRSLSKVRRLEDELKLWFCVHFSFVGVTL